MKYISQLAMTLYAEVRRLGTCANLPDCGIMRAAHLINHLLASFANTVHQLVECYLHCCSLRH